MECKTAELGYILHRFLKKKLFSCLFILFWSFSRCLLSTEGLEISLCLWETYSPTAGDIYKKVSEQESVSTRPMGALGRVIHLGGGVEEDWEEWGKRLPQEGDTSKLNLEGWMCHMKESGWEKSIPARNQHVQKLKTVKNDLFSIARVTVWSEEVDR